MAALEVCRDVAGHSLFSGTGVPGNRVTVSYAQTKDAKGPLARGFAGLVRVNKHGNWQMEANFSYADITRDPTTGEKRLEYHPVETGDDFDERGRFLGYIPLGY